MLGTVGLADMGEDQLLTLAGERAETIREAEADLLRIAYQWALAHSPDRITSGDRPGEEKARLYGGDGTPQVCEFAAAELGARIGRTTFAAGQLMADALDLVHRGTDLWARVESGEVRASYARHVVKQTRHLSQDEAQYVASAVAESADGRIPWSRFEALVEAKVAQAAPEIAREKEELARRATFAKKCRDEGNGMASFLIRADTATIDQIDAHVHTKQAELVEIMPEATEDQRRVRAVLLLLTCAEDDIDVRDLMPTVQMYVHTYAGTDSEGIARLEGHGPVTDDWVRDVLGPTCRFKIYPVLDLEGMAPVDAYEIPDRHRQAVHLMTPADVFPYGSSLSRKQQVDHTDAWVPDGPPGQSGLGNYGPMTVTHHRIKTHGNWQVKQPFPGIYLWRDPHGAHYLVDHTGTRQLSGTHDDLPLVVEIYRDLPAARLEWAA
jgi:hypothetical protein